MQARIQGGGAQGAHAPPLSFGLAVLNLSPTLDARTPMTPLAPPPHFQILDPPADNDILKKAAFIECLAGKPVLR